MTTAVPDRLDVARLLSDAEAATGFTDWGDDDTWRLGLQVFVDAFEQMDPGTADGLRPMAHGHLVMLLSHRLGMVDDAKRNPEILEIPVERPLVILGLPRTGTTILYDLLGLDPATRSPRTWEASNVYPAPGLLTPWDEDPRIGETEAAIQGLLAVAPEIGDMLPLGATLPGECNRLMLYHFYGPEFGSQYGVPEHSRWCARERVPGVYRTHRRILQQLAWKGPRGRWVLKSPIHLYDLEALLDEYPDASLVWTHRDPVRVFTSLTALFMATRKAGGSAPDPREMGAELFETFGALFTRGMQSRENPRIDKVIYDVPFRDTASDPVGTVRRIHEQFGFAFTPDHAERITTFLAEHPHGPNVQRPEDYGFDEQVFRERFASYYERFGDLL